MDRRKDKRMRKKEVVVMKKKWNRFLTLMVMTAAAMLALTACGGYRIETGSVSGGAVSGQAVEEKPEETGMFCNDTHQYYRPWESDDEMENIVERDFADGSERKIKIKDLYDLLCVDNDWIYYEKCENPTDEKTASFWRAPVEKINGKDQVNEEKEELVCKPKDGVGHGAYGFANKVFCNGRFIAHASAEEYKLCVFDIEKGEYVDTNQEDDIFCYITGVSEAGAVIEDENIWWLDGKTGKLSVIRSSSHNEYGRASCVNGGKVFLTGYNEVEDAEVANTEVELYFPPCKEFPDGKLQKVSTQDELKTVLKQEGYLDALKEYKIDIFIFNVFFRKNTVYYQVFLYGEKNKGFYQYNVILSKSLQPGSGLKVEKELTKILPNKKENQQDYGICQAMTDKYAIMLVKNGDDKEQFLYYDFNTGEVKTMTEKEKEWYLPYCNDWYH